MISLSNLRLYAGQRLSLDEFFARYEANPDLHHVELIHGVVVMPSPIRNQFHGRELGILATLTGLYEASTLGVERPIGSTIKLNRRDSVEPDLFLQVLEAFGGACRNTVDHYLEGPPELVIEICGSTQDRDLIQKRAIYEEAGVKEYVVWLTEIEEFRWLVLQGQEYEEQGTPQDGIIKSSAFPGLWINLPACIAIDRVEAIATLQNGLASPEHQQFVDWLQKQRKA
jgi:Uma2 family endonuclease